MPQLDVVIGYQLLDTLLRRLIIPARKINTVPDMTIRTYYVGAVVFHLLPPEHADIANDHKVRTI